jgi:hypothetical protein
MRAAEFGALNPSTRSKNKENLFHQTRPLKCRQSSHYNSIFVNSFGVEEWYLECTKSIPQSGYSLTSPSLKSATWNVQLCATSSKGSTGTKSSPITLAVGCSTATSQTQRPEPVPRSNIFCGLGSIGARMFRHPWCTHNIKCISLSRWISSESCRRGYILSRPCFLQSTPHDKREKITFVLHRMRMCSLILRGLQMRWNNPYLSLNRY